MPDPSTAPDSAGFRPDAVFILGMLHRTGTNHLADLFGLHDGVEVLAPIFEDQLVRHSPLLVAYVDAVTRNWTPEWNVPATEGPALLRSIGDGIVGWLQGHAPGRTVVTKMPRIDNAEHFFDLFPGCGLVVLVRDGRSVVESGVRSFGWSYEAGFRRWADAAEKVLAFRARHDGDRRVRFLRYEDLIADEPVVITVTRSNYVKRQPLETFRRQGRGGKGVKGQTLKEEDVVDEVFTTTTHSWLLFFTTRGKVYRVKVHEVPEFARAARGTYVANLPGVSITGEEKVSAVIDLKKYEEGKYLFFATKKGIVKKTKLTEYDSPRTGLAAINLKPRDELKDVRLTDGKDEIFLFSRRGQVIRFKESLVRPMGRQTAGVIGMRQIGRAHV